MKGYRFCRSYLYLPKHQVQLMKNGKISHLKGILFISFFFSIFIMLLGMGRYSLKLLFILSFFLCLVTGILLDIAIPHIPLRIQQILSGNILSEKIYAKYPDKQLAGVLWLLITLFFIPAYLALFPGTFGYDAPIQAAQYFGEMELSGANPLLHTYLLGIFLSFGEKVLKNASLGLALFCLMQGLLVTHTVIKSFLFLKKIHTPFTVMLIGLLWILCNPTLHVLTFNVTKDILLGVCLLHFLLNLLDVLIQSFDNTPQNTTTQTSASNPAASASEKAGLIRLLLSGIIMCLMRNAAIYLIGVLILVMLFAFRENKKAILSLCVVFLFSLLASRFFTHTLNIPPGDARENMSVPIQQLAAVSYAYFYGTEPADITEVQLETTQELIPVEALEGFQHDTVDPVKVCFDTEVFFENPAKYILHYLAVGRQNPGIYLRSFRNMVYPYFDMNRSIRRGLSLSETFPGISHLSISRYGLFPSYYTFLEDQIESKHYFFLMQPGISIWLIVIGTGISINRQNRKILLCLLPMAIYFVGLLLGPMALLRYLFPMMLATPLLFGILFWKEA